MKQRELNFMPNEEALPDLPPATSESTPKPPNRNKKAAGRVTKQNGKKASKKGDMTKNGNGRRRIERPYPRVQLEDAVKVPLAIRYKNGGNPWVPEQVRLAVQWSKGNPFFYLTTSSRDFGLTEGTRDTAEISLTEFGRRFAYAASSEEALQAKRDAFMNVPIFRDVFEHYNGPNLPEMQFLGNVLESKFKLDPSIHDEFVELFLSNCKFAELDGEIDTTKSKSPKTSEVKITQGSSSDFITVAEPDEGSKLLCFVAMPFTERDASHSPGFFAEVLQQIIGPAGKNAGFRVVTARMQGSDVIHATIINGLIDADLVVVDLTEHNPNVLFELGVRMAEDKPVALIRSRGTKPIFDVDHLLRVEEYDGCLWPSTVATDLPKIENHIRGAWDARNNSQTYMKILRKHGRGPQLIPN